MLCPELPLISAVLDSGPQSQGNVASLVLECRKRERAQTFRISFDYQAGGLPFYSRKRSRRKRVGWWALSAPGCGGLGFAANISPMIADCLVAKRT